MVLSVVTAALYAFASDVSAAAALPDTGSSNTEIWVVAAIAVALVAIAACIIMPKVKK